MKSVFVSIAIGAALFSTAAAAQAVGGAGQHEQTRAQTQQRVDMLFNMLDANHDGTLTRAEAEQGVGQLEATHGGAGRLDRAVAQMFGDAASVTLQQVEAKVLARFDAMDLNHDGTVSASERAQGRQAPQ